MTDPKGLRRREAGRRGTYWWWDSSDKARAGRGYPAVLLEDRGTELGQKSKGRARSIWKAVLLSPRQWDHATQATSPASVPEPCC